MTETAMAGATSLNPIEQALIAAIEAGQSFCFTDQLLDSAPGLSADLIRCILVGLPVQVDPAPATARIVNLRSTGIRIMPKTAPGDEVSRKSMRRLPILGHLELTRLRGMDGGALPDLELTYCSFEHPIDLGGAAMGPVSFEGSLFPALTARDASFQGGVTLDWCGPHSPTPAQTGAAGQGRFPFTGHLFTQDEAEGGGDRPASFRWVDAMAAKQGVAPDTPLAPCIIDFASADIQGPLRISFATFCSTADTRHPLPDHQLRYAANLSGVSVRDTVQLVQTVVYGGLSMKSLEVGEDLWFSGSRLVSRHRAPSGQDEALSEALSLQLARVNGIVGFIECADDLDRKRSDYRYNLVLGGIHAIGLQARQLWLSHGLFAGYLAFSKGSFALGAIFGPYSGLSGAPVPLCGVIDLSYASIENNLEFGEVHSFVLPDFLTADPMLSIHLMANQAQVIGQEMKAAGSILIRNCSLTAPREIQDQVLYLRDCTVADSITIKDSSVRGISLRASRVEGRLSLRQVTLNLDGTLIRDSDGEPWSALDLRGSSFGHDVDVRDVRWGYGAATADAPYRQNGATAITPQVKDHGFTLSFYADIIVVDRPIGRHRYQRYLFDTRLGGPMFMIDGQSRFLHMLNGMGRLRLETTEQYADYLTFFCDSVAGDGGPFKILSATGGPGQDGFVPLTPISAEDADVDPKEAGDKRFFIATILYGDSMFVSHFSVAPDGMVEMLDDKEIAGKLRNRDGYPRRTRPARANAQLTPRDYVSGPAPIDFSTFKMEPPRLFYAHLDLEGMRCGALLDDFGRGWGLPAPERDGCHVQLHAPGIRCGRVEPSADAGKRAARNGPASRNDPRAAFSATDGQGEHKAAHHRLAWLRYQTGFDDRVRPSWLQHIPLLKRISRARALKPEYWRIAAADFVPQVYDEFASAHYSAGEPDEGQRILIAKKDAQNRLMRESSRAPYSREEHHLGWFALLAAIIGFAWWMHGGSTALSAARLLSDLTANMGLQGLAAVAVIIGHWIWTVPALLAGWIGWSALRHRRPWRLLGLVWLPSMAVVALVALALSPAATPDTQGLHDSLLFAILVLWVLLLVYAAWPLMLGVFHFMFKHGFNYGLSPSRAILICAALLVLGTAMTGLARTGSLAPYTDWDSLYDRDGRLKPNIALVLDVQFQAQAPDGAALNGRMAPGSRDRDRQPGATVVAQPTACDVGVNNFLYAADVFVPLVDLEQESRCTIRTAPESARDDPYLFWRIAKSLYEIIGWIVISLTIVTISGVMRRDIER